MSDLSLLRQPITTLDMIAQALRLDPRYADAWFGLGRASLRLRRAEDVQEALRALEQMQSPRGAELRGLLEGKR